MIGWLRRKYSEWRDSDYRCWCGSLVEQRFDFCSQECNDEWAGSAPY